MDLRRIAAKAWVVAKPVQRRWLINLVEQLPGFGSKKYFGRYGEDAFLQAYFREQLYQTSEEIKLPVYFRRSVSTGFYVDIGAHAPIFSSNTYWFYKHGWCGINIDAVPGSMKAFKRIRTRDVNIEALISDENAELVFHYWEAPSSVNTVVKEFAEEWSRRYGRDPKKLIIKPRRLDDVLAEYLPPDQEINFMTIDVEGQELFVLRSNDWNRFRPELVLVEILMRNVDELVKSEVHQLMISVGYYLYAWLRPTVVYRQKGPVDSIVHDFFADFTATHF